MPPTVRWEDPPKAEELGVRGEVFWVFCRTLAQSTGPVRTSQRTSKRFLSVLNG